MTQLVDVPGQGPVEFPDEMPDEQIAAAIKRTLLSPMQNQMGLGKQGDTMESIRQFVDTAPYRAGGAVTDITGSPALGTGANALLELAPFAIGGGELGKLGSPTIQRWGRQLMQSALKPAKADLKSGDAAKAIQTLLDEGVNVTEGGVAKLTDKINSLDDSLTSAIAGSKAKLQKTDMLQSLKDVLAEYRQGTLAADTLPKIRDVARKLIDHPLLRGTDEMTVQLAQDMKRQNYRELGDKAFGLGLRPQAERDALKAVTRDLRAGIEQAVPEAASINAEMGPLINARDIAQDRVLMSANKNPISFGAFGVMNPKAAALWMADRSELIKSLLARLLHSGVAPAAPMTGRVAGGGIGELLGQGQQGP